MHQIDFSNGRITKNILQTALPMLVAQIVNLLYNIVDRIYIGRIPGTGSYALGAVGLCFPLIIIITAFTNLYGSGGAPLCSIERGRGNTEKASLILNLSYFMLTATSLVLILLGELLARPVLVAFGASAENLVYSLPYLRIYLLGTVFSMTATGLNPYINAQGFPGMGMLTVLIGAAANLVLDPLFIFVLGMGVEGAAAATVISQFLSAAFVFWFLRSDKAELKISLMKPSDFAASLPLAMDIISLGTASFVMQFTNSLVTMVCNSVLSSRGGDLWISVMTTVSSVRQMLDIPVMAVGDGSSPVISFNYGAKKPGNVRKSILIMTLLGCSYTLVVWILILIRPSFFISIFTSDEELISMASPALHLYFFAFIFQALQISGQTAFKALNKKKHAIFFSIFRKVIMVVPLTLILPGLFGLGVRGVFMAEPVSNFVGGSACMITMLLTVWPELNAMEKDSSTDLL
ncbi:MAG: MATE family efflux transporter [Lachnospiraceae bacterium]|jgi:putative MATE family efflux protein|nr:MATE family efflux transporter [Lachnospiraceae bacterium]